MTPQGHKPVIGLLGGIGAGKSTIASLMAGEGCAVIDADQLAREAMQDPAVRDDLVQWWGRAVLDEQGQVDRRAVGRIVFQDPAALRRLEDRIHPIVHQRRKALRSRSESDPAVKAIVEDCPLLIEAGLARECDVLVYVHSSPQRRLQRVQTSRGWDVEELNRRQKTQVGLDIKQKLADYVIDNDAEVSESLLQVRGVLSKIFHQEHDRLGPVSG